MWVVECLKVMENLEKIESNLVISLMTSAIKRKEREKSTKKKKKNPYKTSFDIWPFVWLSLSRFHFWKQKVLQQLDISSSHSNYIDHSFAISNYCGILSRILKSKTLWRNPATHHLLCHIWNRKSCQSQRLIQFIPLVS